MKYAKAIAFRRITKADFFNISKPRGHNAAGGGQSYIDLAGNRRPLEEWDRFFDHAQTYEQTQGTAWEVSINSLGTDSLQRVKIGPRTSPTGTFRNISIREQKIHSRESNRVAAWHPDQTLFPALPAGITSSTDPALEALTQHLVVYIVKTSDGEYWAGYIQRERPESGWNCDPRLTQIFRESEGLIELTPEILFHENNPIWPFQGTTDVPIVAAAPNSAAENRQQAPALRAREQKIKQNEEQLTEALFEGDLEEYTPEIKEQTRKVRARNKKAANLLKCLYNKCQITGEEFVFRKTNGAPYTEVHHLIPLGKGGADSPHNLVVVSAHIHRMLHYADIDGLDLSQIRDGKLQIHINGEPYTITWHPEHVKLIERVQQSISDER